MEGESVRAVIAPDKFRGTATAAEVAEAIADACALAGVDFVRRPMSDGGEGLLDCLGGANRELVVTGPLGQPVSASWRMDASGVAFVEAAQACGLDLVGGPEGNDPVAASTYGVGELILAAAAERPASLLVGLGGSATSDGGAGAVEAIGSFRLDLAGVTALALSDVTTPFTHAAQVFGWQKGADADQVQLLTESLRRQRAAVLAATGIDLDELPGTGAAGGLGGGLTRVGFHVVPGFRTLADKLGLDDVVAGADLVITGEGRLDRTSLRGKVVGGVIELAAARGVRRVLAVVGQRASGVELPPGVDVISLVDQFGHSRATGETVACVRETVGHYLAGPG